MKKTILFLLILLLALPVTGLTESVSAALLEDDFAGYVNSAVPYRDGMAILGGKGLFLWHPDTGDHERLLPLEALSAPASTILCALPDDLLLLDGSTGAFYRAADGEISLIGQLPEDVFYYDDQGELTAKTVQNCLAVGDRLCLLLNSFTFENGDTDELYMLDSGFQATLLESQAIRALWSAADGQLLVAQEMEGVLRPCLYDPESRSTLRVWDSVDAAQGMGFVYDAASDALYYSGDAGKVYAVRDGRAPVICAYLPFKYQYATDQAFLWNHETYAYLSSASLFLREIHPEGVRSVTLNLMGAPDPDILMQFAAEHPDISINIQYRTDDLLSLQQSIVASDGSVDLYLVTSDGVFADVREKNFAASLNASDRLMTHVANYYPWAREALMDGDQLIAVPASIYVENWTINRTQWEALDLGDEPDTFADVFTAAAIWQSDYADDMPDYCLLETQDGVTGVLKSIIRQYLLEHEHWEAPVSFDTAEFREVVAAAWEHRDLFLPSEAIYTLLMNYPQYFGLGFNDSELVASFRQPKLTADSPAVTRASMELLIMSPASTHPQEALTFLEFYADHLSAHTRYHLDASCSEPVRPSWYAGSLQGLLEQMESTQRQLDSTADEAERRDLEATLLQLRKRQQFMEDYDWEISPEGIELYREIAASVVVPLRTIYPRDSSAKAKSIDEAVERFASGQASLDQFVRQLDEKARMIFAEMQ